MAVTVKVAVFVVPPKLAEITTLDVVDEFCVRPENVALLFPARTVTLDGSVATAVLLLESATVAPPDGAAAFSVTVPSKLLPALTVVDFRVIEDRKTVEAGVIVRVP